MNLLALQADPAEFRNALLIDTDAGAKRFIDVADPWQLADFSALDDGWRRAVVGTSIEARYSRGWLERPRGHAKSSDLAIAVAWALFAAKRPISGIGASGDRDQALILQQALSRLLHSNPWLQKLIDLQSYKAVNPRTGSTFEIISSDARTSYGALPDFVVCDEVCHWKSRDLWDSLISSSAKRASCMLTVITNAGWETDWQFEVRQAIRESPSWYFSRLESCQASWINQSALEEQRRLLPAISYRRLWENQWSSGGGDALTPEDIEAAFHDDLQPLESPLPGFDYVGGLDLGVSRDASAICILGVQRGGVNHGKIRLAHTRIWRPARGAKVDLNEVERELIDLHCVFNLKSLLYDPWQAEHMAQRLGVSGLGIPSDYRRFPGSHFVPMTGIPQTSKSLQEIASCLLEAFNDRRVQLYPEPDLKRDLQRLRVEERAQGFRLTSPRDSTGHGDLCSAFQLALLGASHLAGKRTVNVGAMGRATELSLMERAIREHAMRQNRLARHEQELAEAHNANQHREGFSRIMFGKYSP